MNHFAFEQRKWKNAAGCRTIQDGGVPILEAFVPYIELAR
jgi:hypothetical protein